MRLGIGPGIGMGIRVWLSLCLALQIYVYACPLAVELLEGGDHRADDEVHEEEGADEGERDKVDQRVGVVLDVRLQVDAARVGAREHEAAPAVEEHALEECEHGVGCRVEVLRRHLVMGRWREI